MPKQVENEPLKIFLAENDIDRRRAQPISPALATRLANDYRAYSSQYSIFADAPGLSEASINRYLDLPASTARSATHWCGRYHRFRTSIGRHLGDSLSPGSIPTEGSGPDLQRIDGSLRKGGVQAVFEADHAGVTLLLTASHAPAGSSEQDRLVDVLVGQTRGECRAPVSGEYFLRVFDAQRLIPLDTLFAVGDRMGKGEEQSTGESAVADSPL